jgi:hypothetical protein
MKQFSLGRTTLIQKFIDDKQLYVFSKNLFTDSAENLLSKKVYN